MRYRAMMVSVHTGNCSPLHKTGERTRVSRVSRESGVRPDALRDTHWPGKNVHADYSSPPRQC